MIVSSIVFLTTLALIILRPFKIGIGIWAMLGAIASFVIGNVSLQDIIFVFMMIWDSTLTLIALVVLSRVLEQLGFFDYLASKILYFSYSKDEIDTKKLFILLLLFGSILSAFFANDGAILILTPIVFAIFPTQQKSILIAFLLSISFIADSTSTPLIISNLTNIITANFFDIGFVEYAKNMFVPTLISLILSIIILYIMFKKSLQNIPFDSINTSDSHLDKTTFYLIIIFLLSLICGFIIGDRFEIPTSIVASIFAILILIFGRINGKIRVIDILSYTPWHVIYFSFGLFVVVFGLSNAGITRYIADFFITSGDLDIFAIGIFSAISSNILNNLPANMLSNLALDTANLSDNQTLIYANILGSNIGTKLTPIGSLATLLWLFVLDKKGVKISFLDYIKFGFVATPLVLFTALLSLYLI